MRRALPAIAVTAAGVAWLLHAQGVIDNSPPGSPAAGGAAAAGTPSSSAALPSTTLPSTGAAPTRRPAGAASGSTTTTSPPAAAAGAVNGSVVDTRFGPVQVSVAISNGTITDVRALQSPNDERRSVSINARALPLLHDEVIAAQNAQIDGVSGATVTSGAYEQSLQAALDEAGYKH